MIEISVIFSCLITLILLKIFLNIRFRSIKDMRKIEANNLEKLADKYPPDEEIAKDILSKLALNTDVKIKKEEEYNGCLYTVFDNTITIGKFEESYMKIQTIAHECIHACQNKRILWSNFIFSNIFLLYFFVISILTLFNKISNTGIYLVILIFMCIIQYIIRNFLENGAMLQAKFIAKEYIEENGILTKEEEKELLQEYDRVNEIGIPFMNFYLMSVNLIKIIVYACIALIAFYFFK